jgi:hypothetical protein
VPSWFEDQLSCAPLGAWLPGVLAGGAVWIDGGPAPPRALARMLASLPRASQEAGRTLVHAGPLHVPPAPIDSRLIQHGVEVVLDLAWVVATAGWTTLRPWRREPARRDVAARLEWLARHGMASPQQWTCTDPLAVVVTLGTARR